ncbi:hypothetical protein GEU84_019505 [Fertoebacter nigrum]|uniref:Uncharacterized protein n=1 Tax=Fertoeibacter niger TaxID=2656921 RepID=A0A8X8H3I5_9RHOB|nr:hypothetical protein [Fertoeibacter niger]NUB46585.1 hypothetical protein [Fertoeibacter niger]
MTIDVEGLTLSHYLRSGNALSSAPYQTLIGDDPVWTGFFTAHPDRLTVAAGGDYSGLASAWASRKTGSALALTQAVSTARPSYLAAGGPLGRGCLRFLNAGTDSLVADVTPVVSGNIAIAAALRTDGQASGSMYFASSGTTGNRFILQLGSQGGQPNHLIARAGASGSEALVAMPCPLGEWFLALMVWNPATKSVSLSLNGGDFVSASNPAAVVDVATMMIGGGGST